jgi:ABC-type transporter Mla MlaB component
MDTKLTHRVDGDKFIIEVNTNRFTQDLVSRLTNSYPHSELTSFNTVEFNLEQVKMIDSSSLGYLFELNNKLKAEDSTNSLIVSVGKNNELKDLLHRFQVDLLINVK